LLRGGENDSDDSNDFNETWLPERGSLKHEASGCGSGNRFLGRSLFVSDRLENTQRPSSSRLGIFGEKLDPVVCFGLLIPMIYVFGVFSLNQKQIPVWPEAFVV